MRSTAGYNAAPARRLLRLAWSYPGRLSIALFSLLASTALGLVYPTYFGAVIDSTFTNGKSDSLTDHASVLILVFFMQSTFQFLREYLMTWVGQRVIADLRIRAYQNVLRMPLAFFHRHPTGELLSRFASDMAQLQFAVSQLLGNTLSNAVMMLGGVVMMLWVSTKLSAATLIIVPVLAVGTSSLGRVIRRTAGQAQDALAKSAGNLQEGLGGIETVQSFGREAFELTRYSGAVRSAFRLMMRRTTAVSFFGAFSNFAAFTVIAGILWLGGQMAAAGEITVGEISAFMLYALVVAGAASGFAGLWGGVQSTLGATERVFELLDAHPSIRSPQNPTHLSAVQGKLEFRDVSFMYAERDTPALAGISVTIYPGEVCALVGRSGSGKTTLCRLVQRFYDPVEGTIELDGHDLRTLTLQDLRRAIGVVSQESVLFSGSVLDNLRYGRLGATDEEIRAAAAAANADEFIRALPDGYETLVGERGVTLSAGQRQRISIARAVLRDPKILILDEATSALDGATERLVQAALAKLQKGRTTLVIAHRLSTIKGADRIVVLEGGRIVEVGRHEDLIASGGAYWQFLRYPDDV